jgi:hypothetical protein
MRILNFLGHLPLNRPSGQLSPRTPPAIFDPEARTNASLDLSSNFSQHNSVPAARTASRKPSIC